MQSVLLVTDAALNKPTAVDVVFITGVCLCMCVCSVLVLFVIRGVTVLWENFQHCQCFFSAMEEPIFNMNWPSIPFQGWLGSNSDSLMTLITTFCLALHSYSTPRSLIGHFHAPVVALPIVHLPGLVVLSVLLVLPLCLAANQPVEGLNGGSSECLEEDPVT